MIKRVLISGCVLTIFMGAHLDDISNAEIPVSQDQTFGAAVAKKQAPEVQMARRPSSKVSSEDFDSRWIVDFGGITGGSSSSSTSNATSDADSTPKRTYSRDFRFTPVPISEQLPGSELMPGSESTGGDDSMPGTGPLPGSDVPYGSEATSNPSTSDSTDAPNATQSKNQRPSLGISF